MLMMDDTLIFYCYVFFLKHLKICFSFHIPKNEFCKPFHKYKTGVAGFIFPVTNAFLHTICQMLITLSIATSSC